MVRASRLIAIVWTAYAHMAGLAALSISAAWLLLQATSQQGAPVVERLGPVEFLTERVPYRGTLSYVIDLKRNASCPGLVTTSLTSKTNHGPAAVVTFRRPVMNIEIMPLPDLKGSIILPDSVFPGRWQVVSSVDSRCPTYSRIDTYLDVEIEVLPPEAKP